MPNEQTVYWVGVIVLLSLAILLGQSAAAAIAAVACILLVYKNSRPLWKPNPGSAATNI